MLALRLQSGEYWARAAAEVRPRLGVQPPPLPPNPPRQGGHGHLLPGHVRHALATAVPASYLLHHSLRHHYPSLRHHCSQNSTENENKDKVKL